MWQRSFALMIFGLCSIARCSNTPLTTSLYNFSVAGSEISREGVVVHLQAAEEDINVVVADTKMNDFRQSNDRFVFFLGFDLEDEELSDTHCLLAMISSFQNVALFVAGDMSVIFTLTIASSTRKVLPIRLPDLKNIDDNGLQVCFRQMLAYCDGQASVAIVVYDASLYKRPTRSIMFHNVFRRNIQFITGDAGYIVREMLSDSRCSLLTAVAKR